MIGKSIVKRLKKKEKKHKDVHEMLKLLVMKSHIDIENLFSRYLTLLKFMEHPAPQ